MDCYLYVFNNIREKLRKNFAIFYQLGLSYQCQFFLFEITLFLKQDLPLSIFLSQTFFTFKLLKQSVFSKELRVNLVPYHVFTCLCFR